MTRIAVQELVEGSPNDPLISNLAIALLPSHAVLRDIYDVLTGGHWLNFGQKHHFMRRFDGQKPYQAYQENVEWIRTNALDAARLMHARIDTYFKPIAGVAPGAPPHPLSRDEKVAGKRVFDAGGGDGVSWQPLGNACHALQDSFAGGHTIRSYPTGRPGDPGVIADVLVYADDDAYKHSHHELDEAWHEDGANTPSWLGRLAINGCKDLIRMVVRTAVKARNQPPSALDGWMPFVNRWLVASQDLVTLDPDSAIRLVRRFSTGANTGLPLVGRVTLNMDEAGLAEALVRELGTATREVHAVFAHIQKRSFDTDSDDVAEEYVERLMKVKGETLRAVQGDPALLDFLITLLEAGWTSGGERDYIDFLAELKRTAR